jgi:dihydrofolate synthase/folylpolyglutamate synthase
VKNSPISLDPFYSELFQRKPELHTSIELKRIQEVLKKRGNPQRRFPAILVAGTNGKGSVTRFLELLLLTRFQKVGGYYGPHVFHPRERIHLNGALVSEGIVLPLLKEFYKAYPELTFFELFTLTAIEIFSEEKVDMAVMEIGLGGRLDAVNAMEDVVGTVITSIHYDHTDVLGKTLQEITGEKLGILRPQVPLFCGYLPPEARRVVEEAVQEKGVPVFFLPPPVGDFSSGKGKDLRSDLSSFIPPYLRRNMHLSRFVFHHLFGSAHSESLLSDEELFQNRLSGRWMIVSENPPKIADGAHNPHGAEALREAIERSGLSPVTFFFRSLKSKDAKGMIEILKEVAKEWVFIQEEEEGFYPGKELKGFVGDASLCKVLSLNSAVDLFQTIGEPAVVTGTIRGVLPFLTPFLSLQRSF